MNANTTTSPRRPTAGIDWAKDDHAVAIVDPDGAALQRFTVGHTSAGLRALVKTLRSADVEEVGIERPDGPVVDALLEAGLTVFVIAPNQVKNLRSRYGSAGNKDDRFDAYVLADTVRTDRHRLTGLTQDSPQTITLRMTVRARKDLVAARVAMANQLRAHLQTTLPGAIGLFRDIDSPITLAFLTRFSTQAKADWLSPARLETWLRSAGYFNPSNAPSLHARLVTAPRGTTGSEATARASITVALVAALQALRAQIKALEEQISAQLEAHPDGRIFTSLPRAGTLRAARLLHAAMGATPSTRRRSWEHRHRSGSEADVTAPWRVRSPRQAAAPPQKRCLPASSRLPSPCLPYGDRITAVQQVQNDPTRVASGVDNMSLTRTRSPP